MNTQRLCISSKAKKEHVKLRETCKTCETSVSFLALLWWSIKNLPKITAGILISIYNQCFYSLSNMVSILLIFTLAFSWQSLIKTQ